MAKGMKRKKKPSTKRLNSNSKLLAINALYKAGQFSEALPLARQVISKNTTNFDLLNIAGLLELQVGSPENAIKWLSLVHGHFFENPDISDNLGSAYCAAGRYEDGREQYHKLLNTHPERPQTWCNLGSAQSNLGDTKKARKAFRSALELDPGLIAALTNLALLEGQSGDQKLALELYYKVLLLQPTNGEIYSDLSRFKKFSKNDPDIAKMEKLISSSIVTPQDQMFLGYALAKAYEDTGQLDKSFENLNIGNSHKRSSIQFDIQNIQNYVETIINTFSIDVFDHPKALASDQTPIFIVGMPRSGTTLVEQIIASHSSVIGGGELSFLQDVITGQRTSNVSISELNKTNDGYPVGVLSLSDQDFSKIGQAYLNLVKNRLNTIDIFTDKMPQNFFFIGLIKLVLPHAKIIHCRRSPLDTCMSCYSIHFPYGQEFSNELTELGLYYKEYYRLMCHWKSVLPDEILDISYEDLVTNPKSGTKKMLEFCELPWEEGCLEFHKTARHVTTASAAQIRQPIYKTAVKRWQRFETHLQPLINALGPLADSFLDE
jgi:tetratricopeptide (TPR) repeat protein